MRTNTDRLVDEAALSNERTYSIFLHLSLLANLITGGVGVVVLIAMWLAKKESSPFIDDHGREALNFQISLLIYFVGSILLTALCGIGVIPLLILPVFAIVGMVMAAQAANRGEYFRYPATIRFIH